MKILARVLTFPTLVSIAFMTGAVVRSQAATRGNVSEAEQAAIDFSSNLNTAAASSGSGSASAAKPASSAPKPKTHFVRIETQPSPRPGNAMPPQEAYVEMLDDPSSEPAPVTPTPGPGRPTASNSDQ